jgi:hypothetical protein
MRRKRLEKNSVCSSESLKALETFCGKIFEQCISDITIYMNNILEKVKKSI